nr:transporter [Theileria orientalis]
MNPEHGSADEYTLPESNTHTHSKRNLNEFRDIDLNTPSSDGPVIPVLELDLHKNYGIKREPLKAKPDSTLRNPLISVVFSRQDTNTPTLSPLSRQHKSIIAIAFFLTFLSNCVGHLIREPLFTTKVNIQKSFGSTTLQLAYLDIAYLASYSIGQFITPIVFPRSHIVMFVCFCHLLLGICHFFLFLLNNLSGFVVIYGVTGFSCAILWLALYNDLHSWLPINYRMLLITFWCCAAELGLCFGIIMCAHVQTTTRWKVLFMITAAFNFLTFMLLFTCYIKPKPNSGDSEQLEVYVPREKLFDPVSISKENYRNIVSGIKRIWQQAPVEVDLLPTIEASELATSRSRAIRLCKYLGKKVGQFFRRTGKRVLFIVRVHLDVMKRVQYLTLYTVGYTSLKSARNCFAFWISFYLTTNLKYSIQYGIYATLVFQLGSCAGSLIAGMFSKLVLQNHHLTGCSISAVFSFLMLALVYFMDLGTIWKCFTYVFLVGLATNCTEMLITTRGLKALCDQSLSKFLCNTRIHSFLDEEEKDYSVSLGTTLSIANFLSVFQGYISIYIAHHFGWNKMFLYLILMMFLSTGALGVPSRKEIERLKHPVL